MIHSSCPRCHEAFRVPDADLPEDAYAQCPWCRETFPIAEVLNQLPPVLEVLSADGQMLDFSRRAMVSGVSDQGSRETVEMFDHDSDLEPHHDHDLYQSEEVVGNDLTLEDAGTKTVSDETVTDSWVGQQSAEAADFDVQEPGEHDTWDEPVSASDDQENIAPMKVTPSPVVRKKKGSSMRILIGYIAGGLLSVPLAIAILWVANLLGWEVDLGFWPLNGNSSVTTSQNEAAPPVPLGDPIEPAKASEVNPGRSLLGPDKQFVASDDPDHEINLRSDEMTPTVDPTQSDTRGENDVAITRVEDPAFPSEVPALGQGESDDAGTDPFALPQTTGLDDPIESGRSDVIEQPEIMAPENSEQPENTGQPVISISEPDILGQPDSNDPATVPDVIGDDKTDDQDPFAPPATDIVDVGNPGTPEVPMLETPGATGNSESPNDSEVTVEVETPSEAVTPVEVTPAEVETPTLEVVDSPKVKSAVDDALAKLQTLQGTDDSDARLLRTNRANAYIAIASVGAVADPGSASVAALMSEVKQSPDLNVWASASADWISLGEERPNEGILVIGKRGEGTVTLSGKKGNVDVSISPDSVALPDSDRVIGIGKILPGDKPEVRLISGESLP